MYNEALNKHEKIVIGLCVFLLIPALLINLGYLAVIEDEAIRGLVALEMWYSGDYIAPTINGVPYYNKPPLYNWIILLSYTLCGQANEFSLRFPTVVFTLLYSGLVYRLYKADFGNLGAVSIALLTVTCGRIFIYDSFLGLIDICFSMCMFSLMIGSYLFARQEQWTKMFVFAYALAAIGFMLKTLPAIVFLGVSLLVICISLKSFKQFFRLGHFMGMAVFMLIVGSYYAVYSIDHDITALFTKMLTESSDRTVVKFGIWKTIGHLFTFPFEVFYHFLPWSIMLVYLTRTSAFKMIWENSFLRMNVLLLFFNILLYWTSPQVYGRYLLMFPPLLFAPLYFLHRHNQEENTIQFKIVKGLLLILVSAIVIGVVSLFFVESIAFVPQRYLKASFVLFLALTSIYLFYRAPKFRLLYIFMMAIVFRIGFDFFVFPHRNLNDHSNELRVSTLEVAKKYKPKSFYCPPEGIFRTNSYYLTRESKSIVKASADNLEGLFVSPYSRDSCKKIDQIKSRNRSNDYLVLDCKE